MSTPYLDSVCNSDVGATKGNIESTKQLTLRSVVIGLFLGLVLCFSNTYFGLQTGWVTMGSLQSSLVGYGILKLCTKYNLGNLNSNKYELNMIQTIAVSSATMPLAAGFVGIIPALSLLTETEYGHDPVKLSMIQLFIWTFALASFGVFVAVPLRKYMIIKQKLPFPSGIATAKMIQLFYTNNEINGLERDLSNTFNPPIIDDTQPLNELINNNYNSDDSDSDNDLKLNQSNVSSVFAGTDLMRTNDKHTRNMSSILQVDANVDDTELSVIMNQLTKQTSKSITIKTKSHSITLQNKNSIQIEMIINNNAQLSKQWKIFLYTFAFSSFITLSQYFAPVLHYAPIFGSIATTYLWNIDISLSYVGQGMIAGLRVGLSMLLGCIIGWALLGPYAVSQNWVQLNSSDVDWQNSEEGWVLWVSLSIMLGESLTSLAVILIKTIYSIIYSLYLRCYTSNDNINNIQMTTSLSAVKQQNAYDEPLLINNDSDYDSDDNTNDNNDEISSKIWIFGLLISCIICVVSLSSITKLQLKWYETLVALCFALIISVLSVRALGETDLNPVSGVGKVSQIAFSFISPNNIIGNLCAGGISEASAAQSGDMLQSFKTGYLLKASPKLQFYGVLIGTVSSGIFSVCAYYLFISVYPDIPNSEFEVPAAELWLNMAELLNGGELATNVKWFCIFGSVIGCILSLCHDVIFIGKYKYINSCIPSGIALAIGFYITPNYVLPRVIGSIFQYIWFKKNSDNCNKYMIIVASGFVLGEGIFSILNAAIKALNVPCCFVE